MSLSHEAIVHLQPPTGTDLPIPTVYAAPKLTFLANPNRGWSIVFSTYAYHRRSREKDRPDARRALAITAGGDVHHRHWQLPPNKGQSPRPARRVRICLCGRRHGPEMVSPRMWQRRPARELDGGRGRRGGLATEAAKDGRIGGTFMWWCTTPGGVTSKRWGLKYGIHSGIGDG